ncbi:porin [Trinickia mobilis]|uniref:porin n=1 Tax=Trinickia mobilis TaxID=2816356 RepID=UPI002867C03C|nr:porin [Trinickia mobilis]
MKLKRLMQAIILSAGLIAESAFAQSSVQLYGILDAFVGEKKLLGGHTAVLAGNGGMTSSFWGMRGSEDIGGGTSVIFALESYVNIQTGQYGRPGYPSDGLFSRNAYVGLKGNYGTLTAGLIPPPLWFSTITFNPFFNSFVFSPIVLHSYLGVNGQGVFGGAGEWTNSVAYASPLVGGFTGKAMYSFGNEAGHLGQNKWSGQVSYNHGSFAASAVWQQIKFSITPGDLATSLPGLTTQSVANFGMSYGTNFVELFGQYQHIRDRDSAGNIAIDTGQIGFSIPVGLGRILGSDAYSKSSGGSTVYRNTWAIGYDYPLSKRTDIYAAFLSDRASRLSSGYTLGGGIRTAF